MRTYLYSYQTVVKFYGNVERHFVKLRCVPCQNSCQTIIEKSFLIHPSFSFRETCDAFGNKAIYGESLSPHASIAYLSSGLVNLSSYYIEAQKAEPFYYCQTKKTALSDELKSIAKMYSAVGSVADRVLALCGIVHSMMEYAPLTTGVCTTAAEAFGMKKGVCQDFSHILISLCRECGIAARYVNGFIAGDGETHAWVEFFDGAGWQGIDPTHNNLIEYGYIKIAHGRDADDCPVNRGVFVGSSEASVEIRVSVNEL